MFPQLYAHLRENRSGIRLWEAPEYGMRLPAGLIQKDFSGEFTKLELPYLDRCSQLAVLAARQATTDGGISQFDGFGQRAGLYYGSVRGGVKTEHDWVLEFYNEHKRRSRPYTMMACMLNSPSAHISIRHQILGPVMTHSSACTSSGVAIGDAFRAIRDGYLDVALAGGAESALTPAFMASWGRPASIGGDRSRRMQAEVVVRFRRIARDWCFREGAVFLMLENREHALARGARVYRRISGYGIASDGYHIGSPKSEGQIAALERRWKTPV